MFSLFGKKQPPMTLEQQLEALAECGIRLNPTASIEDLLLSFPREDYEASAFEELIPILGSEVEREPYDPFCHRLWMCDYERIEDHGAYVDVMKRLHQMAEQCLPITNISDFVEIDDEKAWVEFDLDGSRIHWDAKVDNDWLDPTIVVKFDNLLKTRGTPYRIYSNHSDFGQSAFFACLTAAEFGRFQKLAKFKLREIERQA